MKKVNNFYGHLGAVHTIQHKLSASDRHSGLNNETVLDCGHSYMTPWL